MKTWQRLSYAISYSLIVVVFIQILLKNRGENMETIISAIIGAGAAITVALIGIIGTSWLGWKKVLDRLGEKSEKNLSMKYDDIMGLLKENQDEVEKEIGTNHWGNQALTAQHKAMVTQVKTAINKKIGFFSNSNVAGELEKIQAELKEQKDHQREIETRRQLLTSDMSRIDVSVEALNAFRDLMMKNQEAMLEQQSKLVLLESQLQESQIEIKQLEEMNKKLKNEIASQQDMVEEEYVKKPTHHLSM